MDDVSKAIHRAAGLLDAASMADAYARRWAEGNAVCHNRIATALAQLGDFLREKAVYTRAEAEAKQKGAELAQ